MLLLKYEVSNDLKAKVNINLCYRAAFTPNNVAVFCGTFHASENELTVIQK